MRECIATVAIVAIVSVLSAAGSSAEDEARWTRFRGPDAGAVPDDPSLPDTWSRTENVAWEIDIPGLSWSSPIVWDDHIFITSSISACEEETPIRGLYDPGDDNGSRRSLPIIDGWSTPSTSIREKLSGSASCTAHRPRSKNTSRTALHRKPRSPMASASTYILAASYSSALSRWAERSSGPRKLARSIPRRDSGWPPRPPSITIASTSSTTTRRSPSWWSSTKRQAKRFGEFPAPRAGGTGPHPSSGRTIAARRS